MSAVPKTRYTIEEYIGLLKNSDERFEYFDGEVVSMAGGKIVHGAIAANIVRHLGNRVADRPRQVLGGDVALEWQKSIGRSNSPRQKLQRNQLHKPIALPST